MPQQSPSSSAFLDDFGGLTLSIVVMMLAGPPAVSLMFALLAGSGVDSIRRFLLVAALAPLGAAAIVVADRR